MACGRGWFYTGSAESCSPRNKSTRFITCTGPSTGRCARSPVISIWHAEPSPSTWSRRSAAARRKRASKLDPFKATIAELLEQDAKASALVIAQRLRPLGFTGGMSILKDYLHTARTQTSAQRAYVRMEPAPGERFEIDWGHFGALLYQGQARKLYAFCLVECHSRKLFVEFSHSQTFETFVRCHIHAFQSLGGIARELWYDNLATAVA